jgi:hypothetical protein
MSNSNDRPVVPKRDGGWDVELRIHNRQGEIRNSDTIATGNDPNLPRDRR